jgi:hypothetical protein
MITFSYTASYGVSEADVEMKIDNDTPPNEILAYFQRFMVAAGYVFDEGETIKFVNDRTPIFNFPESFKIGEDSLNVKNENQYDFWDDDGFSLVGNPYPCPSAFTGSGVRGGMSEDIITFG